MKDLLCCYLLLEFLIVRHTFNFQQESHNSSLNFHCEILAEYFIKSTKKECFVALIEIVPLFHYCSTSCFISYFGTPKIDKAIIIDNFQISISILPFMLFSFSNFLLVEYREYSHDLDL